MLSAQDRLLPWQRSPPPDDPTAGLVRLHGNTHLQQHLGNPSPTLPKDPWVTREGSKGHVPVSGVDPAGALVHVVDVVHLPIEVSGLLPTLR